MNDMEQKKLYIYHLACFLSKRGTVMSGGELADHLNRNEFLTTNGEEYQGERGTFRLIKATYDWVKGTLQLPAEAKKVARAFVQDNGEYAYDE